MASAKKYFWLKLKEDFFRQKEVKKLRRIAGGDTFTIIYLKLQLLSMKTEGVLEFTGLEDNFAEELALEIDEDSDNVSVTLAFLTKCGLIEVLEENEILLTDVPNLVGKESQSAERVRKFREKTKTKSLQCNAPVTNCNTEIEIEIEKEIYIDKDNKNNRGQFIEFKEKLEKQFNKPLYPNDLDKIINYSDKYNVNPLEIYSDSDYLKGLADMKPTLAMFFKEETYKKMSQGIYLNRADSTNDKKITEYEKEWW